MQFRNYLSILLTIPVLFSISCSKSTNFGTPEDLAIHFFTKFINLSTYDDFSDLEKMLPNRDTLMDLMNETGFGGNVDELVKANTQGLVMQIIQFIRYLSTEDEFNSLTSEINFLKPPNPQDYDETTITVLRYFIPIFHEKMINAKFKSFTRGEGKSINSVQYYDNSYISFEIGNNETKLNFRTIINSKNGWQIYKLWL